MSQCPQCGTDELEYLAGSSNAYCGECGEVVEPVDADDLSDSGRWACFNCETDNGDEEDECDGCGLSHDASDYLWDNGEPGA